MSPYQPRHVRRLGLWSAGPLQLKAYGITVAPDETAGAAPLHDHARRYVQQQVERVTAEGHHGLGFVIVHQGQGTWLLLDWWAHQDICCQLLAHAPAGSTTFQHVAERPLMACVWELAVIHHERDAWVQTMLTATPDPQNYLDRSLPDGAY